MDKYMSHSLAELKSEVLMAYLNLQTSEIPKERKAELEQQYEDARTRLAKRISIELI